MHARYFITTTAARRKNGESIDEGTSWRRGGMETAQAKGLELTLLRKLLLASELHCTFLDGIHPVAVARQKSRRLDIVLVLGIVGIEFVRLEKVLLATPRQLLLGK